MIMLNEKSVYDQVQKFYKNRINTLITKLLGGGISGYYAENEQDAIELILGVIDNFTIPKYDGDRRKIVGIADSLTLHQINLFEKLEEYKTEGKINIINPFERTEDGRYIEFADLPLGWINAEDYDAAYWRVMQKMREALLSDIFITGANAVTMNGEIISTDGVGNRLAGVLYGPYKAVMVVGRNKIVNDYNEAISRIKNIACPLNNLRHAEKHSRRNEDGSIVENDSLFKLSKLPCVTKGKCMDCGSPMCPRRATMILNSGTGGSIKNRIHIIIVNKDLGL